MNAYVVSTLGANPKKTLYEVIVTAIDSPKWNFWTNPPLLYLI